MSTKVIFPLQVAIFPHFTFLCHESKLQWLLWLWFCLDFFHHRTLCCDKRLLDMGFKIYRHSNISLKQNILNKNSKTPAISCSDNNASKNSKGEQLLSTDTCKERNTCKCIIISRKIIAYQLVILTKTVFSSILNDKSWGASQTWATLTTS